MDRMLLSRIAVFVLGNITNGGRKRFMVLITHPSERNRLGRRVVNEVTLPLFPGAPTARRRTDLRSTRHVNCQLKRTCITDAIYHT